MVCRGKEGPRNSIIGPQSLANFVLAQVGVWLTGNGKIASCATCLSPKSRSSSSLSTSILQVDSVGFFAIFRDTCVCTV